MKAALDYNPQFLGEKKMKAAGCFRVNWVLTS